MRLKQVFIPLRISKGLLSLIAMFVMLLAPQRALASGFPTSTLTAVQDDDVKYTWTVEGMGAFNVSGDVTSPTSGGLEVGVNGCTIYGLKGDGSAPSDFEFVFYKVKIAGITGDNTGITVKADPSWGNDVYFIASTEPGEFYLPNTFIWGYDCELSIDVNKQCTITGIEVYRTIVSNGVSYGWSGSPKNSNKVDIAGAKQNDGSININFAEHQSYKYPFANEGASYSSTDESVATVGTDGTVTIYKTGSTTITATVLNENPKVSENITLGYTLTVTNNDVSYDLSVAGETVTSNNASDVLEDGMVSYDNDSHTLTLNNASIDLTENERSCIVYTGSDDLIIKLIGTNSIKVNSGCEAILYDGSGNNPKLYFDYGSQSCSLMLQGKDGSVIKNFASIKGVNDIGGDTGNYLMLSGLEAKYDVENGLYTGESTNPTPVTTATITSGYGLIVGGVLVHEGNAADIFDGDETNDGKVSYTTNKLTLNGAKLSGESISYVGTENLTIELNGNSQVSSINYVNDNADEKPQLLFTKADGVTSCSLTLDSRGDGSVIDGFSAVDFGTFNTMSSVPLRYGKIDPDENYVCLLDAVTNDFASDVTITTATTYPIWVKGNQVTADNADDLFNDGTDDKDPSVSFTPAVDEPAMPATLTLNGVNYSLNDGDTTPLVVSGLDNLTVKLVGSSSVYTSDQAEVYPDAAFVSTNSDAVLTFTTDESDRLQPLNTNTIELASGFSSIEFTGYLYREQNMVKNLLAPTPSMSEGYLMISRAGYEPEGTTFNYVIEYTDDTQSVTGTYDMSKEVSDNNIRLDKPCAVTVYAQYGTVKSAEKEGRLLGFEGGNELNTVYGTTQVTMPDLVPAIAEADGITIAKEGNFVDNDKTMIDLSGKTIGKASTTIIATLTASTDTPYTLFNGSVSLNVNILPPAPTIEFDAEKTYLNSDKVSISLPESLVEDENASIKYSWVADRYPEAGENYTEDSKVALNAGTNTLYAWVRYNGATADDAVYSERVSQEFTAKTDINQFAVKDLLDNTSVTYTGSVITPTFTLYDAKVETNTLSTDDYDVRIEKFVDETTGYAVVDAIKDAGEYRVYAVGKGDTYGGEKLIYEWFGVEQADLPLTVSDIEGLTYTGSDQSLVTESDVPEGVTVKYYCQYFTFEQYGEGSSELSCDPDAVNFEYTAGVPKGKNAGVYGILYLVDGGDNYKSKTEATQTIWVTIDAATITSVTLSKTEYTFDTTAQTPTIASVKAGDDLTLTTDDYTVSYEKINGDETTTAISASDVKAVGSYNVVVTGTGNFKETAKAPFAIVNRTLADNEVTFHKNWATFYNAVGDVDLPAGIGAFIPTAHNVAENTIIVTPIKNVPQGEAVLLSNDANVVTQTENTSVEGNMLRHTNKNIDIYNSTNYYGLYNGTFMRVSGTISAESNYLLIDMPQAPQLTIVFENEATGINDVRSKKADVRGDFYDLQGRKVEKPSKKGLYINKGHKVVVK